MTDKILELRSRIIEFVAELRSRRLTRLIRTQYLSKLVTFDRTVGFKATSYCKIRKFKVDNNLWFQAPVPNVWDYIAPTAIDLEIIQGSNVTHLTES